jgi:hypothetical protein
MSVSARIGFFGPCDFATQRAGVCGWMRSGADTEVRPPAALILDPFGGLCGVLLTKTNVWPVGPGAGLRCGGEPCEPRTVHAQQNQHRGSADLCVRPLGIRRKIAVPMGREQIWTGPAPVRWASNRAPRSPGARDRMAGARTSVSAPLGMSRESTVPMGRGQIWIGLELFSLDTESRQPRMRWSGKPCGPFALTPALSRRRAGSVFRESSRGRGGTRGCRRWGLIWKEASTGRALVSAGTSQLCFSVNAR